VIIFDEKKYAEKMLRQGYLTRHKNVYELYILSKYYFHQGLTKEDVKCKIVEFCKAHDKHFTLDEWYKIINKTVNFASKNKLITGKEVTITQKELDTIKKLDNLNEQKVAFVMLVLYKFYDYKKFEVKIEDLYRLCKLNLNSKTKLEILHSLTSKGLIDIAMGGKRWVKFADKKGTPVIVIKNFDDFIYEYLRHIGEKIGVCSKENCGKLFKITGKNHKMCRECWKEHRKEQNRENFKRWYDKQKKQF
jgi:predicted DNA-binding transcriptional regulator